MVKDVGNFVIAGSAIILSQSLLLATMHGVSLESTCDASQIWMGYLAIETFSLKQNLHNPDNPSIHVPCWDFPSFIIWVINFDV